MLIMDYMCDKHLPEFRDSLARLDRICPGWRRLIDASKLKMMSHRDCILGQLFGHFHDGLKVVFDKDDERSTRGNVPFANYRGYWILAIEDETLGRPGFADEVMTLDASDRNAWRTLDLTKTVHKEHWIALQNQRSQAEACDGPRRSM